MMNARKLNTPKDYQDYDIFTKHLVNRLNKYPLLKWRTKKTALLVKSLYKKGYSFEDILSFVLLNN